MRSRRNAGGNARTFTSHGSRAWACPDAWRRNHIPTDLADSRGDGQTTLDRPHIRVEVEQVLIPVIVVDENHRVVLNLRKEHFRLYEDGIIQDSSEILQEDTPLSIGIIFDESGSMEAKMEQARLVVSAFIEISPPGDEYFLITFRDRPELRCSFTGDPQRIKYLVASGRPEGATALFDAIYLGLRNFQEARYLRRVLLVSSDGGENNSLYTRRELIAALTEADVRFFSVSVDDRSRMLERISEASGGRALRFRSTNELSAVASALNSEIHKQYVLSYSPRNAHKDGRYRRIKVECEPPAGSSIVRAYWRHGLRADRMSRWTAECGWPASMGSSASARPT